MAKTTIQKTGWQRVRKLFNDIHLWLGLSSGLVLIVVCFSGTVYVFNTELTEWAAPHLYKVETVSGKSRMPADSFFSKVEKTSVGKVISVSIPADLERTYQFNVKKKGDDSRGGIGYFVNPYTGEITGTSKEKNGTKEFMSTMFSLHRWLLLDKIEQPIFKSISNRELGSMISGWATIIFTLGCITGMVIWFPQKVKYWRQGVKIKWNAGWKRLNHDLHNTLAFYALFFLLLMGLTGPQWSFDWYRTGLQKTLGTYKPKDAPKEKPLQSLLPAIEVSNAGLSISDYIKEGDKQLSYQGNYVVSLPADSASATVISKTKTGFFAPAAADRLTVDQYTGSVLKKEIFKEKPFNQRIAGSIKALHLGNVYGTFTKIIYFLACLIATTLPITGIFIWINKMKKKKKAGKPTTWPVKDEIAV
ncbi:MAG TPA: PepSY-associated TM helix domain-containing protein [Ferruginibacter sp.]|nr:PepSY-associated TM helix domain-containing protein [Ferruginibacter sp.]HRE63370.1 PepSY-associated TM helix domain-containing protein [Ferruginibacter sp.]